MAGVEWLPIPNFPKGCDAVAVEVMLTASGVMTRDNFRRCSICCRSGAYRTSPEGKQLRANQALVRLNGYTEAEMLSAVE